MGSHETCGSARRFQFYKRSQFFIGAHDETLSVVAVSINSPDGSPIVNQRRNPAQTPGGFAEIVSAQS
jgi:hypothetical protein